MQLSVACIHQSWKSHFRRITPTESNPVAYTNWPKSLVLCQKDASLFQRKTYYGLIIGP